MTPRYHLKHSNKHIVVLLFSAVGPKAWDVARTEALENRGYTVTSVDHAVSSSVSQVGAGGRVRMHYGRNICVVGWLVAHVVELTRRGGHVEVVMDPNWLAANYWREHLTAPWMSDDGGDEKKGHVYKLLVAGAKKIVLCNDKDDSLWKLIEKFVPVRVKIKPCTLIQNIVYKVALDGNILRTGCQWVECEAAYLGDPAVFAFTLMRG